MTSEKANSSAPAAEVRTVRRSRLWRTRLWWLTAVCAAVAVGLVAFNFRSQGIEIHVAFDDGYGLKPGDTLRYRGIDVGSVSAVQLSEDLGQVRVAIVLGEGNEALAVQGSQFWIERARVRLGQVSGLDTVLGAKYVNVIPGDPSGPSQREFEGLETPLGMTGRESTAISIEFPAGEGLEVGDQVRYRGIAVGEVLDVSLAETLDNIFVEVRLVGSALRLARSGTQFWIERPRLELTEVRGLDTLLGGRYIAMEPTTRDGSPQHHFVGLAEPPPLAKHAGSLEIELDAPSRLGIVRGTPVLYRGLEVGRISSVGLASDGASVKVRAIIDTLYTELVRDNTKWWAVSGFELDASLRGVNLSVDSLTTWIRGGVAFSTPESPGDLVVTGHRFMLEPEPLPEWLEWQPRIALGSLPVGEQRQPLPTTVRVVASWNASLLGLYRGQTEKTWGIALADGTLRVPTRFLRAARKGADDVQIELEGESFPLRESELVIDGEIGRLPFPTAVAIDQWPVDRLRSDWAEQSVMLVVNPELSAPLAIDGTRITRSQDGTLEIAPGVAIVPGLSGSAVVNASNGMLYGLLIQHDDRWVVSPIR